ncbi:MAG: PIN domain-containing protein, partial [Gemmatimonadaceae bacterium]
FFEFIPVDNRISLRAVSLNDFVHKDPADRIIAATALGVGASLVTADERLHAYRPLKTIWK